MSQITNQLQNENSSYLKNYKKSQVNWWPYCEEALKKAKENDKLIYLTIGHSTCHMCELTKTESFEDPQISNYLNENFVSIHIDREEMPDLNQYFQLACQMMNGRGGWPLNVFLTPDFKPFFVGTYFPKDSFDGKPGFRDILNGLQQSFKEDRKTLEENATQIVSTLKQAPIAENKIEFPGHYPHPMSVLEALENYQDNEFGGYGTVPKFAHFSFFEWAIEQILEGMIHEDKAKFIILSIEKTLMGALFDHARGGVHSFSEEQDWSIPNFEKNLYAQAAFLKLMSKTSLLHASPLVFDAIIQTLDYLKSEMQSDQGFFFTAQDGYSGGAEGVYFTFTKDEFETVIKDLEDDELSKNEKILKWFSITEEGNFENGLNTIRLDPTYKEEYFVPENWFIIRKVKEALLKKRQTRIPPKTDNKGITSWNLQIASALIDLAQYCKIEVIQQKSHELLAKLTHAINNQFMSTEGEKAQIITSTSKKDHAILFEDYVMYSDYCFRCYEVTGDKTFYINGINAIDFIMKNFHQSGQILTRSSLMDSSTHLRYDNIHTPIVDSPYKSSLATFIGILRKWSLSVESFKNYEKTIGPLIDTLKHLSLQNPLAFGETLRCLTYPDMAYRKIEIPRVWFKESELIMLFPNFSFRFAICAHEKDETSWSIKSKDDIEPEIQGHGLEDFKKVFTPNTSE